MDFLCHEKNLYHATKISTFYGTCIAIISRLTGPRFVLNLIKVFEGSFGGATLYENPSYVTPNAVRNVGTELHAPTKPL